MIISRLVIFVALFCIAGFFAVNTYQHWQHLIQSHSEQASKEVFKPNFFRDHQAEHLAFEAIELRREIKFNQWADEQHAIATRLLKNIRARIQERPFEGHLWLELLNAQYKLGLRHPEFSWSLVIAIRQNGWQKRAFATLAYYCIHQKQQLNAQALMECRMLLSQPFAASAAGNVKKKLGVDKQRFKEILQEARTAL